MPGKIKLKGSKPSRMDGRYTNTLLSLDKTMMSARREIGNPGLLAEFLNSMNDWHGRIEKESKIVGGKDGR